METVNSPANPAPKTSSGAQVFFFFFLQFVLLYMVSISIGGALFNIIDRFFPVAEAYYYTTNLSNSLRYHLSTLIIGTPIFLWLARKIYKHEQTDEHMSQSGLRRWLTYLTLIIAALTVIGDLISLVFNLLGGETEIRFILKSLVILAIAGAIFYYYLTDVKGRRQTAGTNASSLPRIYFWAVAAVALAAIITSFFFITPPKEQRERNRDAVRVTRLSEIDNAILQYAVNNQSKLPTSLNDIIVVSDVLTDPVNGEAFTYRTTSSTGYELCATFETSNKIRPKESQDYYSDPGWLHDAGETCFQRDITFRLQNSGYPIKAVPSRTND